MGNNLLSILILAGIALFLLLRLRNVLGTREGYEKPREMSGGSSPAERDFEVIDGGGVDEDIANYVEIDSDAGEALVAMKRADPEFSVAEFISGARQAYEMIIVAFEAGDLETLGSLLSQDVFESFASVVDDRIEKDLTVEANFIGVREAKILDATFDDATGEADVTMRFVAELTSSVRNAAGEIVEGSATEVKRQRDNWTFSRMMRSDDPNWLLVATEQ
jgi:predicted lipid-binding transport protein (Tim44 family)